MVLIKKCQTKLINFMAMTRILATMACLIIAFNQAGSMSDTKEKYQIVEKDGYNLVIHPHAPVLGYSPDSGVGIIMVDGLPFKDLNRNGKLEPYEDWRLPAEERATDLASRLTVEQIAGLMLYSSHQPVPNTARPVYGGKPFAESGAMPWSLTDEQKAFLLNDNLRAVLVTKAGTPELYTLLQDVGATCDNISDRAKQEYKRTRPFVYYNQQTLVPEQEESHINNGSYPSGHTVLGWTMALLLSDINPAVADQLLARGFEYGQSRVIAGYHWQSDVDAGRLGASVLYAKLQGNERFREQLEKAKQEFKEQTEGTNSVNEISVSTPVGTSTAYTLSGIPATSESK